MINLDYFGWWHLACQQYSSNSGSTVSSCTLYNENIEVTKNLNIIDPTLQTLLPKRTLSVSFGYSYIQGSQLGVAGFFVKHFRFWSRAVSI